MKRLRVCILAIVAVVMAVVLFCTIMAPRWRMAGNEASAIAALRNLSSAEELYNTRPGRYGSLQELYYHNMIDRNLANATTPTTAKDGYYFALSFSHASWWSCVARPAIWGVTGRKNYQIAQDGVIHYNEAENSSEFTKALGRD